MNLDQMRDHFSHADYNAALDEVLNLVNKIKKINKLSYLKMILQELKDEQTFYMFIRILDYGLMYQYSNFLAHIAYKQHQSLWTLSWNVDDYIENGKTLEMAQLLGSRIEAGELAQYPKEIGEKINFTYVQVLIELKRFNEVEEMLKRMQAQNESSIDDKWGYYFLEIGEREKAKQSFLQGRSHSEYGHKCYAMLSHIDALDGNHESGFAFLEEGLATFGNVPNLLLERIRRLRDLRCSEDMHTDIEQLENRIPDSFYSPYLSKLKADYFYDKSEYDALDAVLAKEKSLNALPYHSVKEEGNKNRLHLNPVIQKSNYCVPASLSMILRLYGDYKHQDEIADCIFDKVGSKLSTTVSYWESIGYSCNYVTANLVTLKQCIDNGMPILLSVNVGLFSHVQIVTGYDDRLGVVYIQDANTFESLLISYEEYNDTYCITNYLGIVGVPQAHSEKLQILDLEDDIYYRWLFEYLELLEKDENEYLKELITFLDKHWNHDYTKLFIIKHLHDDAVKEIFNTAVKEIEEVTPVNETVSMHIANGFLNFGDVEEAKPFIQRVKKQRMNGFYHFLKGRIAYEEDHYDESIQHFKWSLKADADDALTWSYLAVSYLFNQELQPALETSMVAYESQHDDLFIILNHCKVLMANNLYEEALQVLILNPQIQDDYAYKFYTLAKIYQGLSQLDNAIASVRKAIDLDPQFTNAHLLLANLLDEEKNDQVETEKVLLEGIEQADEKQELIIRLGQFYLDQQQYEKARQQFQTCIIQFSDYAFGYVKYADTLVDMGMKDEAHKFFEQYHHKFQDDIEYLINAGISFLYNCEDEQTMEKGITFLEQGIEFIENNWMEPLNLYAKTISENKLFDRGIAFLTKMIDKKDSLAFAFQTYKGMLLDDLRDHNGILLMKEAFEMKSHVFTAYQLGEAHYSRGELEEAKENFAYCLEQNSQDVRYLFRLIEIAQLEEDEQIEKKCYQKLFEIDFSVIDFERFFQLLNQKEIEEYIAKLSKDEMTTGGIERLDCLAYAYGALGDFKRELEILQQAMQIEPTNNAIITHRIEVEMREKNWIEAQKMALTAIEAGDFYEPLYVQLAEIYYQLGKYLSLEDTIKSGSLSTEDQAKALTLLANYLYSQIVDEEFDEIEEHSIFKRMIKKVSNKSSKIMKIGGIISLFEEAISLSPTYIPAYLDLARFYEETDLPEDGVKVLKNCLKYNESYDVMHLLAMLHLHVADDSYREDKHLNLAIEVFEEIREKYPHELDSAFALVEMYVNRKEFEKAHHLVDQLLQENRDFIPIRILRADILNREEKYEESIQMLEQIPLTEEYKHGINMELLKAYVGAENVISAVKVFNNIILENPENNEAKYYGAIAYTLKGKLELAMELLTEVLNGEDGEYFTYLAVNNKVLHELLVEMN
ncbi:C39 family peptidase [Bacillus sp. JJ722]|uniref:C39 family peptidase n=1 Tax=Bacillus sp. JJ722 TaxID=3122973 RepID=UPI002FFE4F28